MIFFISFIIIIIIIITLKHHQMKELFENSNTNICIIISKKVTENMYRKYTETTNSPIYFISDQNPNLNYKNIYYYPDEELKNKGFTNTHNIIPTCSWDKVIYFLKQNKMDYKYVWIIEDDCYLNKKLFNSFINLYNKDNTDLLLFGWHKKYNEPWSNWNTNIKNNQTNQTFFEQKDLCSSITQIIRITPKVINRILEFQQIHNRLCFHEILFSSITNKFNLKKQIIKRNDVKISAFQLKESNFSINKLEKDKYIVVHPYKLWYNK